MIAAKRNQNSKDTQENADLLADKNGCVTETECSIEMKTKENMYEILFTGLCLIYFLCIMIV